MPIRTIRLLFLFFLGCLFSLCGQCQSLQLKSQSYRVAHGADILRDFAKLLRLPNVASSDSHGMANILRNAKYIRREFERRGVRTELLNVSGGFPAIYGELDTPGAQRTIVFYAHYDGQPSDANRWRSAPFTPTLRPNANSLETIDLDSLQSPLPADSDKWRLFSRSSSDDKAPIIAFLVALDSLKAAKRSPSINVKFFLESEEERGSEHLDAILARYRDKLHADLWVLCDGPIHQSGQSQLIYGARGVLGLEMQTFGANRSLHSGHYGNWVPNPAVEISYLIASIPSLFYF